MSPTVAGLLQVGVLMVALAAVYKPLGDYMARVFTDREAPRGRAGHLPGRPGRTRTPSSAGPVYAAGVLGFSFVSIVLLYLIQRLQPLLPFDFGRGAVEPGDRVQHGGQLRDQHELAVLRAGDRHGPHRADARADRAELRVRGGRPRGGDRAGSRVRPVDDRPARQLLGRPDPRHRPDPAADGVRVRDRADRARRGAEPARPAWPSPASDGSSSTIALAPGRVAGGDQGARHQRRRHLQRQLRAPVREPQRLDQPHRDLPAAGDPGVSHPDVRHAGRQPQAGLRAAVGDGRAVGRDARGDLVGRGAPERPGRAARRRGHGGQGGPVRHPGLGAVRRLAPPARRPARSTRCTTASPASAAAARS